MKVIELDVKNMKLISKKVFDKEPTFGEYPIDKSKTVAKCNRDLIIFDNVPYQILEYNFIEFEDCIYIISYNKWIVKDINGIYGNSRYRNKSLYYNRRIIYDILKKLSDLDINEILMSKRFLSVIDPINNQQLNKLYIPGLIEIIFSPFSTLDSYSRTVYLKQIEALKYGANFDFYLKQYVRKRIDRELIGLKMRKIFYKHNMATLKILNPDLSTAVDSYIDFRLQNR